MFPKRTLFVLQICVKKRKAASFGGLLHGVLASSHATVPHVHPPSIAQTDTSESHPPPIPHVEPHKLAEHDLHDIVKDIRKV